MESGNGNQFVGLMTIWVIVAGLLAAVTMNTEMFESLDAWLVDLPFLSLLAGKVEWIIVVILLCVGLALPVHLIMRDTKGGAGLAWVGQVGFSLAVVILILQAWL